MGRWSSGTPGQGTGWFSLQPDLNGNILVRTNRTEFPATNDKPKTVHEDLMIVYPDPAGLPSKAIYFANEHHVINYTIVCAEGSIVRTSDKVQNVPIFRLTYESLDEDRINVALAMSQEGVNFRTYTEGTCKRI